MNRCPARTIVAILSLFLLGGCFGAPPSPDAVLAPEAEARTREAARTILSGDPERVRDVLTASATPDEVEAMMPTLREMMNTYFPAPEAGKLQLVHAENRLSDAGPDARPIHQASYELTRADDVLLVEVAVVDGGPEVAGLSWFNVRSLPTSLTGANDFGEVPLTAGRAAFVVVMALNVAFIVITVGFIAVDRDRSRRWLWAVFALFGMWGTDAELDDWRSVAELLLLRRGRLSRLAAQVRAAGRGRGALGSGITVAAPGRAAGGGARVLVETDTPRTRRDTVGHRARVRRGRPRTRTSRGDVVGTGGRARRCEAGLGGLAT